MTLDEAIRYCEEVAEKNENDVEVYEVLAKNHKSTYSKLTATKYATDCAQCAADHRQLAEWLTELKELRNSIGAVKLNNMKEALKLIRAYKAENIAQKKMIAEYKRLLKAAIEDVETLAKAFAEDEPCGSFTLCSECPLCIKEGCSCREWRYKAEALKLIGGETDENP